MVQESSLCIVLIVSKLFFSLHLEQFELTERQACLAVVDQAAAAAQAASAGMYICLLICFSSSE